MRAAILLAAVLLNVMSAGGCGQSQQPAVRARFDPQAALQGRDFFALPFPTDLRRSGTGLELTGFPNPGRSSLLSDYLVAMRSGQPGFGLAAALYASFTGPVDPTTLTAETVLLVDLSTGDRVPLQLKYFEQATLFVPAATVAALPLFGAPLQPAHAYALVLTDGVHDAQGHSIGADAAMSDALHGAGPAAAATAPFVAFAAAHAEFKQHSVLASVFTTQDAGAALVKLRAAVHATPAPAAAGLAYVAGTHTRPYHLFAGTFPVPNFQSGTPPYLASGGQLSFHPVLALVQTFAEPADPISYARLLATPPGGQRSVMLTEGLLDPYTAADASEALGAAAGYDIGGTAAHESAAFVARGLAVQPLPFGVLPGRGVLLQYPDQGHFAILDSALARCRWIGFLDVAAHGGAPRVDPCGG